MESWTGRAAAVPAAVALAGSAFAQGQPKMPVLRLGIAAAVDQVEAPTALERGFLDKNGGDLTIPPAFASGVEALNALQADDIQLARAETAPLGSRTKRCASFARAAPEGGWPHPVRIGQTALKLSLSNRGASAPRPA